MFLRLLTIETRKTFKHPALWIGLIALVVLLALGILTHHLQIVNGYRPATGGLEQDLLFGLSYFGWIGVLVYAVTASVISAFDYPDRSIQLWLMRGVPRTMLLLARLLTILLFGFLMVIFAVIAIIGLGALFRVFFFDNVDASNLNLAALLPVTMLVFCTSIPYLTMTVLFATISRSPLFAAGGTIVYGTIFETYAIRLGGKFPELVKYLPISLSRVLEAHYTILDHTATSFTTNAAAMSQLQALPIIGSISIILCIISLVIFSRQNLGG